MKSKNEDPAIGASSDDAPILDDKPNKRVDFDEIESKKATKASSRPVAKFVFQSRVILFINICML